MLPPASTGLILETPTPLGLRACSTTTRVRLPVGPNRPRLQSRSLPVRPEKVSRTTGFCASGYSDRCSSTNADAQQASAGDLPTRLPRSAYPAAMIVHCFHHGDAGRCMAASTSCIGIARRIGDELTAPHDRCRADPDPRSHLWKADTRPTCCRAATEARTGATGKPAWSGCSTGTHLGEAPKR